MEMLTVLGWDSEKLQMANSAFKLKSQPISSLETFFQVDGDNNSVVVEVESRGASGGKSAADEDDISSSVDFCSGWPHSAEELIQLQLLQRAIENGVGGISSRAKTVISMRHGVSGLLGGAAGDGRATLKEISNVLGASPEAIRQIEGRALHALRNNKHVKAAILECFSSGQDRMPIRAGFQNKRS